MRMRPTARILLIDSGMRVLLFRFSFKSGPLSGTVFWATPGGEVEEGESFEDAAKRELKEEAGIEAGGIALGDAVTEREFPLVLPSGEQVHAVEKIFVVYTKSLDSTSVTSTNQTKEERQFLVEHRWWSADDIDRATEKIYPEDLGAILRGLAR